MKANIYLAEKIKVGFNIRADTYTGALGYVLPWDTKKKIWRQETSWLKWIETYKSQEDLDNDKLEQFTLARNRAEKNLQDDLKFLEEHSTCPEPKYIENYAGTTYSYKRITNSWEISYWREVTKRVNDLKDVEGYYKKHNCDNLDTFYFNPYKTKNDERLKIKEFNNEFLEGFVLNKKAGDYASGWNHRQAVCRIYDPRGFEIEISIENLLYILEHTNSIVGKGLEGKFKYGWASKKLVLLPQNCPEIADMTEFTKIQEKSISSKDLEVGKFYKNKQNEEVIYLGKHNVWHRGGKTKKHVFFNEKNSDITHSSTINHIAEKLEKDISSNLLEYLEKLEHHSEFFPIDETKNEYIKIDDLSTIVSYYIYYKVKEEFIHQSKYSANFKERDYYQLKQYLINGKEHKEGSTYFTVAVTNKS